MERSRVLFSTLEYAVVACGGKDVAATASPAIPSNHRSIEEYVHPHSICYVECFFISFFGRVADYSRYVIGAHSDCGRFIIKPTHRAVN